MTPDAKTLLRYIGTVAGIAIIVLVLYLLFGSKATAQDYSTGLNYNGTTETATFTVKIPVADAQYYNKRYGTDDLLKSFGQWVQKEIRSKIRNEQDNDWKRRLKYLTPAMKSALEQIEADSLAAQAARAQEIGFFQPEPPPVTYYANIGKSYGQPTMGSWSDMNFAEQYAKAKEVYGQQADPFGRGSRTDPETSSPPSASSRLSQPSSSSDWHSSNHSVGMLSDSDVWYIRGLIVLGLILGTVIIVSIVS